MKAPLRRLGVLAALAVVTGGCASAQADNTPQAASAPSRHASAEPRPTGSDLPSGGPVSSGPSASALMVCGTEIRMDVQTLLGLSSPPPSTSSWSDAHYRCTYHLAEGPLVVEVKEAGSPAGARSAFSDLQQHLGMTQPLHGLDSLGLPALQTRTGIVAFVKDDKTLEVDATGLPARIGHRDRSDLAYTVATDILGCWNGS